jgi:hypothetical protein
MNRTDDLIRLYRVLDKLEASLGGKRFLAQLAPSGSWPQRGIYFFFEPGEVRVGSGHGPRLVRIGTHCLGRRLAFDAAPAPASACRKVVRFRRESPRVDL